jgi:hypothetical protein
MVPVQPKESRGLFTLSPAAVPAPPDGKKAADNYLERVRAYIPVEVIAFFIFANSLVGAVVAPGKPTSQVGGNQQAQAQMWTSNEWVAVAALAVGAVGTIIYARIGARANGGKVWGVQATLSLFAFLIWTYAMGAKAYDVVGIAVVPAVSAFLLATFTLFSGLVVPLKPVTQP